MKPTLSFQDIDKHFNPVNIDKDVTVESIKTLLEEYEYNDELECNSGEGPGSSTSMDFNQWHKRKYAKSDECLSKNTDLASSLSLPTINISVHKCDSSAQSKSDSSSDSGCQAIPTPHDAPISQSVNIGSPNDTSAQSTSPYIHIGNAIKSATESDLNGYVTVTDLNPDQDALGSDFLFILEA